MATQPKRMSAEDRRSQVLDAAMDLFARQGYRGTTTRQIADHAGVNEAIIFRHFASKEELYWAILDHNCRFATRRKQLKARLGTGGNDDRQVFAAVANDILTRNAADNRFFRLLMFSGLENHRLSHRYFRTYLARNYNLLAGYIRLRIAEGAFRPVDPTVAARGFLGMVIYHFLVEELFARKAHSPRRSKRVSEALADLWLKGIENNVENGAAPAGTPADSQSPAGRSYAAALGISAPARVAG